VTGPLDRLDTLALRQGVSVAVMFALPFGVAAAVVHDERKGLAVVLAVLALAGLFLGAGVAGWKQGRGTPLTHGIVTAVGVFAAIQAIGIVRRLIAGDPLHGARILSSLVLSGLAGVLGGLVGSWTIKPSGHGVPGGPP